MFYVYILFCSDRSFYVGYTSNLVKRIKDHKSGNGSFYIKSKLPVKLVYYETLIVELEAIRREKQIKGWSRLKKINLINFCHPTKFYDNNSKFEISHS